MKQSMTRIGQSLLAMGLVAVMLLLAMGCGSEPQPPIPAATAVPVAAVPTPTATAVPTLTTANVPTETPEPTAAPETTETPLTPDSPEPTATPDPTAAPMPEPTDTPALSLTPHERDVAALTALYEASDGDNWANNAGWLSGAPLGEWYGVTANGDGRVVVLVLAENALTGGIPNSLGDLTALTELDLSRNRLTSGIPTTLGELASLRILRLGDNRFTGPIPEELGNLRALRQLELANGGLTGAIPPSLGNLHQLSNLGLDRNQLSGSIPPDLGRLSNLSGLWLHGNQLTGEIPSELGDLFNLRRMSLAHNRLMGEIPPTIGRLTELQLIRLDGNPLGGCIPQTLRQVSENDLSGLGLRDCAIVAVPTPTPQPVFTEVRYIDDPEVPYLTWEIGPGVPEEQYRHLRRGIVLMHRYVSSLGLPQLRQQVGLYLYRDLGPTYARVKGISEPDARRSVEAEDYWGEAALDEAGGGAIFFVSEKISRNSLTPERLRRASAHELSHIYQYVLGNIGVFVPRHDVVRPHGPAWLHEGGAEFQMLRALGRGGIFRYETVRGEYARWAQSADAPLSETETYNGLKAGPGRYAVGTMAAELLASKAGDKAVLTYWSLLGPETTWQDAFETAFGLTTVEFYELFEEHRAEGYPKLDLQLIKPEELSATTDREALVALYNATAGAGWANSDNWVSAQPLDRWFGVQVDGDGRVTGLDLRNNQLIGELPPALGELNKLRIMILGGNQLAGPIPWELGSLASLEVFSLWDNRLTGPIPAELGNIPHLKELYFWGNQLTGEMPSALGSLTQLTHFSVGSNRLVGEFPPWLADLDNLQDLHLPDNQFTGSIPPWVAELPLRRLVLTSNQLAGDIPKELSDLTNLEWLFLVGNNLTGCVPAEWHHIVENDTARLGLPDC